MAEPFFHCECTVETDASPAFAWSWWTDIRNWSDPPATFALDGPFAAGSRGTTYLPEQPPLHWVIAQAEPGACARIEGTLDGATMSSAWTFEGLPDGRTKLTQRIELDGENAAAYGEVGEMFRANLPEGMKRIAGAMKLAESGESRTG
jgi:polyketide cyclase/dehydrase/lipid transport protein